MEGERGKMVEWLDQARTTLISRGGTSLANINYQWWDCWGEDFKLIQKDF